MSNLPDGLEEVEVDWARVLAVCNAMVDQGIEAGKDKATTPEMLLGAMLCGMQIVHAANPTDTPPAVASIFKRSFAHFAAEYAAGNIPIRFPAAPTTEEATPP